MVLTRQSALDALLLAEIALGVAIVGLAILGYRRNESRPMLFLAVGIGLLTVLDPIASIVTAQLGSIAAIPFVSQGLAIVGLCCILYSILLARRT